MWPWPFGFRWSSVRGHDTCEGCAEMGGGIACGIAHGGHMSSSICGHEACQGYAEMGMRRAEEK
eukprot:9435682-Pyramimonas_sp.AAC.1